MIQQEFTNCTIKFRKPCKFELVLSTYTASRCFLHALSPFIVLSCLEVTRNVPGEYEWTLVLPLGFTTAQWQHSAIIFL